MRRGSMFCSLTPPTPRRILNDDIGAIRAGEQHVLIVSVAGRPKRYRLTAVRVTDLTAVWNADSYELMLACDGGQVLHLAAAGSGQNKAVLRDESTGEAVWIGTR